jgi:hypothetical protein
VKEGAWIDAKRKESISNYREGAANPGSRADGNRNLGSHRSLESVAGMHVVIGSASSFAGEETAVIAEAIDKIVASNGRIYEVRWDSTTGEVCVVDRGPAWSPLEDGATSHVGYASSESEAMEKAKAATYEMLSSFDKYVRGTTLGKSEVIAVHLLLEHILVRCLYAVLPKPDSLFRNRTLSFSLLISLCEALSVFDAGVADILRKVNALRNKCAHRLVFHPSATELEELYSSLWKISPTDPAAEEEEEADPWPLLWDLLERRAIELGATEI